MFKSILVPVDLAHADSLGKAIATAADLGKHFGASVTFLGATSPEPNELGHSPEEFGARLAAFAAEQGEAAGVEIAARHVIAHDPAVDLVDVLIRAVRETGADLVVMASHQPGMAEHVFASHGGAMASHAPTSVMVIR